MRKYLFSLLILGLAAMPALARPPVGPVEPASGGLVDLVMLHEPQLPNVDAVTVYDPRLRLLWLEALRRPEPHLRRQAAEAFAKAHRQGMTDLVGVPAALTRVVRHDRDVEVRLAAARALVELDARNAAKPLLRRASDKTARADFIEIVTPALARWGDKAASPFWLKLLNDTDRSSVVRGSAAKALAQVGETRAIRPLMKMATDRLAPANLRLAAAQALGDLARHDVAPEARPLARGSLVDRLVAVYMLASDRDGSALALLRELAGDKAPTVAAAAVSELNRLDIGWVRSMHETLLANGDANVRYAAAWAMAQQHDGQAVAVLAKLLNDSSVKVRTLARKTLADDGGQPTLAAAVRARLPLVLAESSQDHWRALEQGAYLAAALGDKAVATRLSQLLIFDRPEVRLAAASALRELAVPDQLPAMIQRLAQLTDAALQKPAREAGADSSPDAAAKARAARAAAGRESTQLLMAMGQMGYAPSEGVLVKYIPKGSPFTENARSAAIWSLGLLHADQANGKLVGKLISRLNDENPMNPESDQVRRFAATSLGRMKAKRAVGSLKKVFGKYSTSDLGLACRWAIGQITGETPPLPDTPRIASTGWFLEPLK